MQSKLIFPEGRVVKEDKYFFVHRERKKKKNGILTCKSPKMKNVVMSTLQEETLSFVEKLRYFFLMTVRRLNNFRKNFIIYPLLGRQAEV